MNTYTINTKKASTVAKALLPLLKNAEKNMNTVLTEVAITEGALYATDRYIALEMPITELLKDADVVNDGLTGYRLSLAQIEAISKIKPVSYGFEPVLVANEEDKTFTLKTDNNTQIGYGGSFHHTPDIKGLFPNGYSQELGEQVGFSTKVITTITKIAAAVKAPSVFFETRKKDGKLLEIDLTGSILIRAIVMTAKKVS